MERQGPLGHLYPAWPLSQARARLHKPLAAPPNLDTASCILPTIEPGTATPRPPSLLHTQVPSSADRGVSPDIKIPEDRPSGAAPQERGRWLSTSREKERDMESCWHRGLSRGFSISSLPPQVLLLSTKRTHLTPPRPLGRLLRQQASTSS